MEEAFWPFSYQHMNHPCFLEETANYFQQYYSHIEMPLLLPQQAGEMSNAASSCFTCYNSSDVELVLPTPQASSEKTRKKSGHGSCLKSTGQSKGGKGSTNRRQKKAVTQDKQAKAKELNKAAASEGPPSGYIHVRARRGQATDSHSLAERVRRERISERMKRLQELVPGCDKVIGKALVLDEIINYVQSLQNQVEFLSMKLTSANPVIYDFGADYNDELMNQPEELGSMSQPMPSVVQHTPPTAFEGAANNFQIADASLDGVSFLMQQVGGHATSGLLSQVELHNMFSFH